MQQCHIISKILVAAIFTSTLLIGKTAILYASYTPHTPATFEADSLEYLLQEERIIATGNVDVQHEGRKLNAESVSYDKKNNIISAEGNIHLENLDGSHYFADKTSLNDQLTEGEINGLNGRLSDGSLIAADSAQKKSQELTILNNAAYTACKVCSKKNDGKALWRVSAKRVKIDENRQRVSYKHAVLDVYGFPVLYTPYLSHHTPNADKKSGFLVPVYKSSSTLGLVIETPYYFNIAPNMDFTLRPIITSDESFIMAGEYRHLTKNGQYEIKGSITNPRERDEITGVRREGDDLRSHIEGKGSFTLKDNWSTGFDFKHSSDDTYLRRYDFGNEDVLISQAVIENIDDTNYFGARTIHFRGLNSDDDPETTPLVLPLIDGHYQTETFNNGSHIELDGNILALTRDIGVDSKRVSSTASWNLPYTSENGHLFEFVSLLRGDAYFVDNVATSNQIKDGFTGRIIPEIQAKWSYPLTKQSGERSIFIEPVIDVIASPNGGNPDKIPNEDSLVLELSDVNLFSSNHFAGLDRVESGVRTNYGIRGYVSDSLANFDFLLGQSYRASTDNNFTEESGLNDNFSDFVGRFAINTKIYNQTRLGAAYRFRIDKDDYTLRRNEVSVNFDLNPFSTDISYVMVDEENSEFDQQEIVASGKFDINDSWSINVNGHRNLSDTVKDGVKEEGWRSTGFGITYQNECLKVNIGVKRDFFRDRDIEPSTTFMLRIGLTNLGI